MVQTIEIRNIQAGGDLSIITQVFENADPNIDREELVNLLLERLAPALNESKQEIATEITRNMRASCDQILNDIHIRQGETARTHEAVSNAVWSSVAEDRITEFELKPHFRALARFFADTPAFLARYAGPGQTLSLKGLPRALLDFKETVVVESERVRLQYLRGVTLFLGCRYGQALKELEPLARQHLDSPAILTLVAESALNIGQFSVALRHFENAFRANTDFHEHPDLQRAVLLSNIGACHEELLESESAIECYREALAVIPRNATGLLADLVRALAMNNLGYSLMTISNESDYDTNLEEAEQLFLEALELRDAADDTEPNLASVMFNIAEVKRKLAQPGEASYWLDRAEGRMSSFARPHILDASIWNAKGKDRFDRGEYREAVDCFRRARTTLEANFGENGLKVAYTTYSIFQALAALSDPEAQSTLTKARSLALHAISNETHPFLRMIDDDMKMLPLRRAF